jgi:hypothetical protein
MKFPRRRLLKTAAATAVALPTVALDNQAAEAHPAAKTEPTVKSPVTTNVPRGLERDFDPYYNVVRGRAPASYHPWVANRQDRILLYTRTAGPRHAHLGPALAPGLNPPLSAANILQNTVIRWMAEVGVQVDWTEDVNRMPGIGSPYKAVVFGSTSRDTMWKHGTAVSPTAAVDTTTGAHLDAAKTALRQYMRAGGGFVAIHNAVGGTEYNWVYYEGLCGGTQYYDHGALQDGEVVVVAKDPINTGLPARWAFKDEWYNWMPFPDRVKFLLAVDESSLATKSTVHPGHGNFHPLAWCQYYDGGRAFITALGHDSAAWTDGSGFVGQAFFKQHIVNGILSTMGKLPFCT